ncbi:DUF726-domain-containing protein [Auricularia subglabra TFB-10046 SS5]|nr:DUF726-domain-containing protein [Auricularia subglabra TFB-10046 SS5]
MSPGLQSPLMSGSIDGISVMLLGHHANTPTAPSLNSDKMTTCQPGFCYNSWSPRSLLYFEPRLLRIAPDSVDLTSRRKPIARNVHLKLVSTPRNVLSAPNTTLDMADGERLAEHHLLPVLVAAKAAVLAPPPLHVSDADRWWTTEGQRWLEHLCGELDVNPASLPDEPTPADVAHLRNSLIPRSDALDRQIALLLLRLCIANKDEKGKNVPSLRYTASSRALLSHTLAILQVPGPQAVLNIAEHQIADELYTKLEDAKSNERTEELRKKRADGWGGSLGRWAATGVGVVLGGVAIGVTGGLAAPLLVPLVPFLGLSAVTAPVVLGSLFGLAGGGLTGYRVRSRWAGVDRFQFVNLAANEQDQDPYSDDSEKQKRILASRNSAPSMTAVILIPGLQIQDEEESLSACKRAAIGWERDVYALDHSPAEMLRVGRALNDWILGQVLARVRNEVIKMTALGAVMAALALPVTVYGATGMVVDNDWVRACDRAKKAGQLLAEVLRERVQGERPVILVGSSLGGLVLFEALLVLSSDPTPPLVDTAIFVSSPMSPSKAEWSRVRRAVGRRMVNAYCASDLVLATVGRLHEVVGGGLRGQYGSVMGLAPCGVEGVEDVDLGEDGTIEGHFDIAEKYEDILRAVAADV